VVTTRIVTRRPASNAQPATPATAEAGGDAVDSSLVRNTWTQAPGNRPQAGKPGADGPAGREPTSIVSRLPEVGAMLPPAGTAVNTTAVAGSGTTLRLVNSKRIAFGYEVKNAGAGSTVEVWGTQDMKKWTKYEPVMRTGHSCVVEVKAEGLYGFVLRARGEQEREDRVEGELPQVWVAVDVTRPAVRLLAAEMDESGKAPALVLRWSATDRNLGSRPVTLAWAEKAEGPWTTIAANVENTGRYAWTPGHDVPAAVHVRVQAADLMGNLGTAQTANRLMLLRAPQPAVESVSLKGPELTGKLPESPGKGPELSDPRGEESHLAPRLVSLPPTPPIELPKTLPAVPPAVRTAPRPQVSIVSVEPEHN
jgi:hypothetical protein